MPAFGKTALVTGGAGFIGSHMVDLLLAEGFRVRAVDNLSCGRRENLAHHAGEPRLAFEERDVRDVRPGDPLFEGVDVVFHFAGIGDIVPSIERPADYLSANVMGTVCALEAARASGAAKFVYAASSSCYGLATELPTTEDAPIDPQYPYALTKFLGEQMVLHWGQVYRLPVLSLRLFNVYGPRSRTSGTYGAVFGVFLAQKLAGRPFTVVGDGTQVRDFTFVTDVVQAFCLAADSSLTGECLNIGTGEPQSVNRLVKLLGGDAVHLPKRPGEPDCTQADARKAREKLGWRPKVSFEEGVKIMLKNIDYWRQAPVWDPLSIEVATKDWFRYLGKS